MSSRRIEDLVPELQTLYSKFKDECDKQGLQFIVTCTLRLRSEQKALVASGASKTMNSKHLVGKAFDIAAIVHGKVSWQFTDYVPFGLIAGKVGLTWGGAFKGFVDACHFELKSVSEP